MDEEEFTLTGIKVDGKSLLLASGSWGEVRKVEHDGIQRAAKKLLSKPTDVSKFLKDCMLYSKLVHRNVLPVLGLCKCDQSDVPAIVMELMECNLAAKLQQHQNIPINLKLSMLHDISEGLHYLHTYIPPIVHGNLHSKNIFLTSSLVAKIGDFLPLCVPREACNPFLPQKISCELHAPSLDIFAFGCVICHVITEQLPMPSGSTSNEVKLRQNFIDQIELEPLKQLVMISLDSNLENRPPISLVCERIANIRSERITSIRDYHLDQWTSSKTGCEASSQTKLVKVVILGAPGVGKTSLAKSLLSLPITKKPKMTLGIDMHMVNWATTYTRRNESEITSQNVPIAQQKEMQFVLRQGGIDSGLQRVSLLDFAGQIEYHPTHSLFIPKNSVVIIAFNVSMEVEEFFPNIHFCMSTVHLAYSETNVQHNMCDHDSPLHPPVLLCGTHTDLLHSDFEVACAIAKAKFIPPFIREFSNKPYIRHLVGMNRDIETALTKFCHFVSNFSFHRTNCLYIGKLAHEVTLNFSMNVKATAGRLKCSVKHLIEHTLLSCLTQVMPKSQMVSMITEDTMAESSEDPSSILRDLHNKRAILHFTQVESLKDVVIPNPHWLAKLFGYVLTTYPHDVLEPGFQRAWQQLKSTGILHECLLHHILAKYRADYPSAPYITYQQLQKLLVSFHLLACVTKTTDTGDVFIVPSLAPASTGQEVPLNEQKKAVVNYVFHDDFAPALILNQLIAGCISRTINRNQVLCWVKNGKVKLQLGTCLNYYINLCKDKKGIQLIITSMGTAEVTSYEEMRELISDVADLLDDIMKLYMPAAKRPVPFYPLPLWSCDLSLSATGARPLESDHVTKSAVMTVPGQQHIITDLTQKKFKTFLDYYAKLSIALSFKNMASHFVSARIISTDENQVIQHTIEKSKIACLVLNKIKDSLEIGDEEKFNKFLAIMESYDDDVCAVRLAKEMKQKLLSEAENAHSELPKSKRPRPT